MASPLVIPARVTYSKKFIKLKKYLSCLLVALFNWGMPENPKRKSPVSGGKCSYPTMIALAKHIEKPKVCRTLHTFFNDSFNLKVNRHVHRCGDQRVSNMSCHSSMYMYWLIFFSNLSQLGIFCEESKNDTFSLRTVFSRSGIWLIKKLHLKTNPIRENSPPERS